MPETPLDKAIHTVLTGRGTAPAFFSAYTEICGDNGRGPFGEAIESFKSSVQSSYLGRLSFESDMMPRLLLSVFKKHLVNGGCPEGTQGYAFAHIDHQPVKPENVEHIYNDGIRVKTGAGEVVVNVPEEDVPIYADAKIVIPRLVPYHIERLDGHVAIADHAITGGLSSRLFGNALFSGPIAIARVSSHSLRLAVNGEHWGDLPLVVTTSGTNEYLSAWTNYTEDFLVGAHSTAALLRNVSLVGFDNMAPGRRDELLANIHTVLDLYDEIKLFWVGLLLKAPPSPLKNSWELDFVRVQVAKIRNAIGLIVELAEGLKGPQSLNPEVISDAATSLENLLNPFHYTEKSFTLQAEAPFMPQIEAPDSTTPFEIPANRDLAFLVRLIFDSVVYMAGAATERYLETNPTAARDLRASIKIEWNPGERVFTFIDKTPQFSIFEGTGNVDETASPNFGTLAHLQTLLSHIQSSLGGRVSLTGTDGKITGFVLKIPSEYPSPQCGGGGSGSGAGPITEVHEAIEHLDATVFAANLRTIMEQNLGSRFTSLTPWQQDQMIDNLVAATMSPGLSPLMAAEIRDFSIQTGGQALPMVLYGSQLCISPHFQMGIMPALPPPTTIIP